MKIRVGFVSNSSSSSFLLILGDRTQPDSAEQFARLFRFEPDEEAYDGFNKDVILRRLYDDVMSGGELSEEQLKEWLEDNKYGLYAIDYTDIFEWFCDPSNEHEKIFDSLHEQLKDLIIEALLENHTLGFRYYVVTYSDNDGEFMCAMEHGKHWRRSYFPIITISHH